MNVLACVFPSQDSGPLRGVYARHVAVGLRGCWGGVRTAGNHPGTRHCMAHTSGMTGSLCLSHCTAGGRQCKTHSRTRLRSTSGIPSGPGARNSHRRSR